MPWIEYVILRQWESDFTDADMDMLWSQRLHNIAEEMSLQELQMWSVHWPEQIMKKFQLIGHYWKLDV